MELDLGNMVETAEKVKKDTTVAVVAGVVDAAGGKKTVELESISGSGTGGKRIVDYIKIEPAHRDVAVKQAEDFNIKDPSEVSTFAVQPQMEYFAELKGFIGDAPIRDLGKEGAMVVQGIDDSVSMVNFEKIKQELMTGKLKKMLGFFKGAYYTFEANRTTIVKKVEKVEEKIKDIIEYLKEDSIRFMKMYGRIETRFYTLGVYIFAGEMVLEKAKAEYEEMANRDGLDPVEKGRVAELLENILAFDQRLLRIKNAYVSAPVTLLELRIQITAGREEINNMVEAMTIDLPAYLLCLNQIIGLKRIMDAQGTRRALEERRAKATDVKDELLEKASTASKDGALTGIKEIDAITASIQKAMTLSTNLRGLDQRNIDMRKAGENTLVEQSQLFEESMQEGARGMNL